MSGLDTNGDLDAVTNFMQQNPDIDTIEVLLTDLNGILRGKWLPIDNLPRILEGNFKMPFSATTPDIWGRDIPSLVDGTGDGDGICHPVLSTLKRIPWLERPTAQLLLTMTEENGTPWDNDCRALLEQVMQRYEAKGWRPVTAPELEFYLFLDQRDELGTPQLPDSRVNGRCKIGGQIFNTDLMHEYADLLHDMRKACEDLDLPLDTIVKELSPGQFELNLHHVDDPLKAADNGLLLKRVIKNVAHQHGFIASFMAKPFGELDGNGMHIHASIIDEQGHNLFDNGTEEGSELLLHAIAGLQQTMADTFLMFAPHLNSFRRYKAGSHAPVAPTWGYENRDVSMRIPNGDCQARRIEYRVAGADANPYLALAALLAGMLYGIEHKLLPSEPCPMEQGPDEQPEACLPHTWHEALQRFEQSEYVAQYLGEQFQTAFSAVKHFEQAEFEGSISPLEYDTYLVMS